MVALVCRLSCGLRCATIDVVIVAYVITFAYRRFDVLHRGGAGGSAGAAREHQDLRIRERRRYLDNARQGHPSVWHTHPGDAQDLQDPIPAAPVRLACAARTRGQTQRRLAGLCAESDE